MSLYYTDQKGIRRKLDEKGISFLLSTIPSDSEDDLDSGSDSEEIGGNNTTSSDIQLRESQLASSLLDTAEEALPEEQLSVDNILGEKDFVEMFFDSLSGDLMESEVQEVSDPAASVQIQKQACSQSTEFLCNNEVDPQSHSSRSSQSNERQLDKEQQPKSAKQNTSKKKTGNEIWRKRTLNIPEQQKKFIGCSDIPVFLKELDTPFQIFKYFFSKELMQKIIDESRLYSVSKDPSKPLDISEDDLHKFLGICILTSVCKYSNIRQYWDKKVGVDVIKNALPLNMFEKIRANLHFNDNSKQVLDKGADGYDKLYKLRPVLDEVGKKFLSVPMEECLSIDEQMCATKARHHLKQYMPQKPHKWGYKLFVLCGVSGFAYKFEIYTGAENEMKNRLHHEPDLGASGNIVVRLCREIPRGVFHKVYFDNYYTSLPLVSYLAEQGIHSLGTVRRNRIPQCKLPNDDMVKKEERGFSVEYCTTYNNVEVSNLLWKDNKCVCLLSIFAGTQPEGTTERFDRKGKTKKTVKCPAVIREYNRHMGGVDLLDSLLGRHHISIRSRKWYMRLFYHIIDITVVNSWLLHRNLHAPKYSMKLLTFRLELATTLCTIGHCSVPKRGRPSPEVQNNYVAKKSKGPTAPIPPPDVRCDRVNHFPVWNPTRLRCKFPTCGKQTFVVCNKCGVALCFNKDTNCFLLFHTT